MPGSVAAKLNQVLMDAPRLPTFFASVASQLCCALALVCAVLLPARETQAAPFIPTTDAQVLERLPSRATDPQARELQALRLALTRQPDDLDLAVRLAQRYFDAVAAEGDPRYIGYAEAALKPWWTLAEPPVRVRVLRAKLVQFDHRFDAALTDLAAALKADPADADAWAWQAAIQMVQADYAAARRSCARLAPLTTALIAAACTAQVDAATGRAAEAADALRAALLKDTAASPAQRLWALTRLAETEERRGAYAAAEQAFRAALALDVSDIYLLAAYADFLLDRDRAAETRPLLKDRGRADVLLLRQVLAAQVTGGPERDALVRELGARFDAARLRGDTSHRKEEARYLLALGAANAANAAAKSAVIGQALVLAQTNFAEQREPADARLLLEAALAARQPAAAEPALQWLVDSQIESVALRALAAKLKEIR